MTIYRVVFFTVPPKKMTKCQITCKSLQKSSKCQNFRRVWHLVIFWADQSIKPPYIYYDAVFVCLSRKMSTFLKGLSVCLFVEVYPYYHKSRN